MEVYRIDKTATKVVEPLFAHWPETLIYSCLQGYMGSAWADCNQQPKSAQIVVADFCFLAGQPSKALVKNKPPEHRSDFVIMVPQMEAWAKLIEQVYQADAKRVTRYAIKKEPDIFDTGKLTAITETLSKEYELKLIDRPIYEKVRQMRWSEDLCSQFDTFEKFAKNGLGVVALHQGEIVSGASSYTVYRDGIEIEIDTQKEHRRKGLALACGAKLLLECMKRNLYPSWDAQNKASVALAEKLGYHFDQEYTAYEIHRYGIKQGRA